MKNNTQVNLANMTPEEILAWAKEVEEENRELRRIEALRKGEEALKEERKKESKRFIPTRNTLVLRRTSDHELIAPARDVLDYLKVYDLYEPLTKKGKKTKVSDADIKSYQDLRDEGVNPREITAKMLKDRTGDEVDKDQKDSIEEEDDDYSEMEEQD